MAIPELYKERENGEHQYLCSNCKLEIFFLKEFKNCPRCGVKLNWEKIK